MSDSVKQFMILLIVISTFIIIAKILAENQYIF
jgi:hypothetical protein